MDDTRIRVATTKDVNLAQLDTELGGYGLCGSTTEIVAVEGSPVTAAQLAATITAHVPAWPERDAQAAALAHAYSLGFTDEMIAVMYPMLAGSGNPEPTADDYTTQLEPLIEAP